MLTNDPLGQGSGKPLPPSFDPVQGAEEILALSAAFKKNWPAVKLRIADRASAMFSCYAAIAARARANNRFSEEVDAIVSEAILVGNEIVAMFRGDIPPLRNDWDATGEALVKALEITAEALGLATGEAAA